MNTKSTDTNKLPAEVLVENMALALEELIRLGQSGTGYVHANLIEAWETGTSALSAYRAAYDASPGPALAAENARLREAAEAARRILERWDVFLSHDGWGNQADAYYSLAKGASNDWEALRTTLKYATGGHNVL